MNLCMCGSRPENFEGGVITDYWMMPLKSRDGELTGWAVVVLPTEFMVEDVSGESQADFLLRVGRIINTSHDFNLRNGFHTWTFAEYCDGAEDSFIVETVILDD